MIGVGEIVERNPPHGLAHIHPFSQHEDAPCELRQEPKPVGAGYPAHAEGHLRVRPPRLGTRVPYALFKHLEFVLPAGSRAERWPLVKPTGDGR